MIAHIRIYALWAHYDLYDKKIRTQSAYRRVLYFNTNDSIFFIWGILSFSMISVVNRDGLIALRFFQGAVQSGYVSYNSLL